MKITRMFGDVYITDTVPGRNVHVAIQKPVFQDGWRYVVYRRTPERPPVFPAHEVLMERTGLTLKQAFKALRNHIEGLPQRPQGVTEDELQTLWAAWA